MSTKERRRFRIGEGCYYIYQEPLALQTKNSMTTMNNFIQTQQDRRRRRKKGEDLESEKAAATTSTGTHSAAGITNQEQHEGLSINDAICKRKALNKSEKQQIKKSLSELKPEVITAISLVNVHKQLSVEVFCNSIIPNSITFLAEHLHQIFVKLYDECSIVKKSICSFRSNGTDTAVIFLWKRILNCH